MPPPKHSRKTNRAGQAQPRGSAKVSMLALLLPAALLVLAAATSRVSQLTLAPVFGAIPSAVNHSLMILVTFSLGVCLYTWRPLTGSSNNVLQWLAVWAFWIPVVQSRLLPYSGTLGLVEAIILNGFLSCHTIIIPSAYGFAEAIENTLHALPVLSEIPRIPRLLGLGLLALVAFSQIEKTLTEPLAWTLSLSRTFTPIHLQVLLAACYSGTAPSRWLALALPAILHTAVLNPHAELLFNTNQALAAHNWTLLDRAWSNTGYISVLQSQENLYRVLRCDHSLLGGEWLLTPERASEEGWQVNEPIYAAFAMLEAVRLLQPATAEDETSKRDTSAQALVIGLGIGTAPKAFLEHGIQTTIVELDPVVHRFATTWFDLPTNHTAVLQDAMGWVAEQAFALHQKNNKNEDGIDVKHRQQYDYIIHDVFTGGAEPLALFNTAFLRNLRTLLAPQGIIALNYAGDLSLPLTRLVLNTISHVFAGQCKIFRDAPPEKHANAKSDKNKSNNNGDQDQDFLNLVVFCRNRGGGPISFRKPRPADFLRSLNRQHYLLPKPEMEIPFPRVSSVVGSSDDGTEQLLEPGDEDAWASVQAESARRHWHIMRKVVPDAVWELW